MKELFIHSFSVCIVIAILLNPMMVSATSMREDTYLNEEIQECCKDIGNQYCISEELLMAIIEQESRGIPNAENNGCKGLMQINAKFHTDRMKRLGVKDIYSIDGNIHVGADYLVELFEEYGEIYLVLMVYNMGPEKAKILWEQEKISKYALAVTKRSAELERLHGK